jgi:hypothetical protein
MSDSTLDGVSSEPSPLRRRGSRTALAVLALVVLLGATSMLGVHTSQAHSSRAGYTLELEYPRVARAGLDVDWELTVTHEGGFGKNLVIRLSAQQFDIYEHQAFYPSPDTETRDGNDLILTFVAPPGTTFVLGFDAYVQPSSQLGRDGSITVVDHGAAVASLSYTTWLVP